MKRDDDRGSDSPTATPSRRSVLGGALAGAGYAGLALAAPRVAAGAEAPAWARGPLLKSLLQRNHQLHPEYGGGFSNHLSMALYSLAALGGGNAELTRYAESQWRSLEPLPGAASPQIDASNWPFWLGKREALNGYRSFFAAQIASQGRAAALRSYLPRLLPGVGAAAFHPLIRVGYGVRFDDDQEVADGLSYWATTFLPLGALGRAGTERDPRILLAKVHEHPRLRDAKLSGRLITGPMRSASELPDFPAAVDALRPGETTLAGLAAATLRLYLLSGDFTALHAVTGTHAYRLLSAYVEPESDGIRYFWQALVAAYISVGAPRVLDPPADPAPPWDPTLKRAAASLDPHDLKLVDIAHQQESFYHDPLYRRAAARRMGLG